jgi:hypothetical protein
MGGARPARAARPRPEGRGRGAGRGNDLGAARKAADRIAALYAGRPELAGASTGLAERRVDAFDADALFDLVEAEVLAPLDAAARREVEAAARQVAIVTALVPMALADVAAALTANLRMIRRIAEIYGGRSGAVESWRLTRRALASRGHRRGRGGRRSPRLHRRRASPVEGLAPLRRGDRQRRADSARRHRRHGGLPPAALPRPAPPDRHGNDTARAYRIFSRRRTDPWNPSPSISAP